jgi:serine/threonine protein kinase
MDHPNIINVREIWEWDKMLFIVTDYCYGGELFEHVLDRNALSESESHVVMKQCLNALNYLNANQVCHRDIKLENLMLQNPNDLSNLKLIDFGLSKDIQ